MTTEIETPLDRPDWLTVRAWPFRLRSIQIDGATVAYTDEGHGPVLLLVHDGMWQYVWRHAIDRLRADFRVVSIDFPGSGLSTEHPDHDADLLGDSYLLERFVDALGVRDLVLVAHDLGGLVGVGLAARVPELVRGLVFVNSFAWPPHSPGLRTMFRFMTSAPVRNLNVATKLIPQLTSTRLGVGRHLDDAGRRAFLGPYAHQGRRLRFHTLMESVRRSTDYLREIEVALRTTLNDLPTMSYFGEWNDPFGFQKVLREIFPSIQQIVVKRGMHFPMMDDPDLFASSVREWHGRRVTKQAEGPSHAPAEEAG